MGTRFALLVVWLLHLLPFRLLALVGHGLGVMLFLLPTERRRVALTNLALCFPALPADERRRLARAHFAAFTRSVLDRGIAWWSSRERLMRIVQVEGWEHLDRCAGRPVVLLAPHLVGLDIGAQRMAAERDQPEAMPSERLSATSPQVSGAPGVVRLLRPLRSSRGPSVSP